MSNWSKGGWLLRSFLVCLLAIGLAYLISFALNRVNGEVKVFNPLGDLFSKSKGAEEAIGSNANIDLSIPSPDSEDQFDETSFMSDSIPSPNDSEEISPLVEEPGDSLSILVDYTPNCDGITRLREWLEDSGTTPLHIAFFSDSFTEGDILVADLRRMLQQKYGGKGVGYLPVTSPTARFRTSIKHRFSGQWKAHTLLEKGVYTASGQYDHLSGSGEVTFKMRSSVDRVALLYQSKSASVLTTTINDTIVSSHDLSATADGALALWEERGQNISSLKLSVQSADIDIHGIYLDGASGVSVDNMSRRGASGGELTRLNDALCSEMSGVRDYRFIILSFGLNALSTEENGDDYYWYYRKMKKSLEHIKALYPDAVVLLLSVSDRATIEEGNVTTLKGVYEVRAIQKKLAQEVGCLYWDTYKVIQELGGVKNLVEKGWMAKDYTHLSGAGGRQLAKRLYLSLVEE
ncbi:hypothetical protein [Porphyromonas somerae]|uniref:hypothetical protein n=1 Tax=Porphyromonas somerae TaxID=322095 RepID=UPI002A757C8E|nr:hypothetical protein [Porphyromonas somerae]MDY3120866.1 hypothetical protein [Porphyromonas somerae]